MSASQRKSFISLLDVWTSSKSTGISAGKGKFKLPFEAQREQTGENPTEAIAELHARMFGKTAIEFLAEDLSDSPPIPTPQYF